MFVTLTCAFRYGREDLDVLGLTFRKDLFVANIQAFPPVPEEKKSLTRLQERLIKKLGEHAHPFTFEVLRQNCCSVWFSEVFKHAAGTETLCKEALIATVEVGSLISDAVILTWMFVTFCAHDSF